MNSIQDWIKNRKEVKVIFKDKSTKKPRSEPQKRRKGKLTISEALNENERQRSLASIRRRQEKAKNSCPIHFIMRMLQFFLL